MKSSYMYEVIIQNYSELKDEGGSQQLNPSIHDMLLNTRTDFFCNLDFIYQGFPLAFKLPGTYNDYF